MKLNQQIAGSLRAIYFGGNWTAVSLKEKLADVDWEQATQEVAGFHSIATLVLHMNYYVQAVIRVMRGGVLDAKDAHSFNHAPIGSEEDWQQQLGAVWDDAESLACSIEQLPEHSLWETFCDEKYGNYYRNFHGIIEHNHYHLGQIALLKKLLSEKNSEA